MENLGPQSCVFDQITFCMFGVRKPAKPSLSSAFVVWLFDVLMHLSMSSRRGGGGGGEGGGRGKR